MVMEIEGIFQRAKNAFGEVLIVMTGGDEMCIRDRFSTSGFKYFSVATKQFIEREDPFVKAKCCFYIVNRNMTKPAGHFFYFRQLK